MANQLPSLYAGIDPTLENALNYSSLILSYNSFSAAGTQSVLIPSQASAKPRQYLMLGNATISMTSAIAQAIVADPNGQPITSPLESQRSNLATGMVTYFTNIPAAADGAYCYAFAVGGLLCSSVIEVVLRNNRRTTTSAVNPADIIKNILPQTVIGGPAVLQPGNQPQIALNGSSQILLRDGTTALTYGTNTIVIAPDYGVIFGALAITDITDAANANDLLELEIRFR